MFVRASNLNAHVQIDGPAGAPALLLLHSLGTSLHVWDAPAAVLRADLLVIRPDLRGHGLSEVTKGPYTIDGMAQDMLTLMDALGVEVAHVGGISIGGMIAQAMAAAAPARVASLILVDTAMAIPPPETWQERAGTVRSQGIAAIEEAVMARWVTPGFRASPAAQGLRAMLLRTDPEGYAAAAEAIGAADLSARTPKLRGPALILVGEHDQATPLASADALREALLDSTLEVVPHAAHIPIVEQPEAVTAAIRRFLARHHQRPTDSYAAGLAVRRQVLGEAHVARATEAITEFDRDFQQFITRTAWGEVWTRPGLDRRTRSLLTLSLLAALGHHEEFRLHLRATRNTGASAADVAEALLHVAVYAGIPAANSAVRLAKQILAEMEGPAEAGG
jgi:3-oxoadipate enol-lactonase/4-carboxymuconolactone decarboxylase